MYTNEITQHKIGSVEEYTNNKYRLDNIKNLHKWINYCIIVNKINKQST